MSENQSKIGDGHAAAMARLGLAELRNAFYPGSNVAQQSAEYGVFGKPTPGETAEARREEHEPDQHRESEQSPILGDRLRQADALSKTRAPDRDEERSRQPERG